MNAFSTLLILTSILGEDDDEVFNEVTIGISIQGIPGKVPDIPINLKNLERPIKLPKHVIYLPPLEMALYKIENLQFDL